MSSTSTSGTSPGRVSSISRPDWPWAATTFSPRTSQSSLHPHSSSLQSGWDPRSVSSPNSISSSSASHLWRSTATPNMVTTGFVQGESTRHWTFMGFEWAVRDVHKLRDFVEGIEQPSSSAGQSQVIADDFEILRQSPVMGDSKFKLEIAPIMREGNSTPSSQSFLSLYVTSLMMDYAQGDYETSASMMAGIKCQDDRIGERGARPDWVWEFWQNNWVFRQESEVWECPLPSLSSLLENQRIRETDSLVICVQIHSPIGPSIPQQPSVYYVPRDLLDGLEASLDNPNTGDVRFVCLERLAVEASSSPTDATSHRSASSVSSQSLFPSQMTARRRIIYAHSDILTRRSEYFASMLSSSFSENSAPTSGERKLYTVIVEEADYETIYWLLKFCYANWLLFKQNDDPRAAVDGVGAGRSAKWLNSGDNDWDWKTFHRGGNDIGDTRSIESGDSLSPGGGMSRSTSAKSEAYQAGSTPTTPSHISSSGPRTAPSKSITSASISIRPVQPPSSRRTGPSGLSSTGGPSSPSSIPRSKAVPVPPSTNFPPSSRYPVSPSSTRQCHSKVSSTPDPHPHPTPAPAPASALSMYQVAHRYAMPGLATLALEHIMSTITPQSCFAMLLATTVWDELHSLVEDYVIDKWDEVSLSAEFEQCCEEVAAGEWGQDGGKNLMAVFRRLRSPATTAA